MSALNSFNGIARYYDFLKRVVFGRSVHDSQVHFLRALPQDGPLLILGGGSGEVLESLLGSHTRCAIWYVEASSAMLSRAVARVPEDRRRNIHFVHGTEKALPTNILFKGVVTHFFLDLFTEKSLMSVCHDIADRLRPDGVWLVSDFIGGGKWWQRFLLRTMYGFFAITCNIEARKLPPWEQQLRDTGMEQTSCRMFYRGFIKSCVYKKPKS